MNETERLKLLRAVAECAPEEMGARLKSSSVEFNRLLGWETYPPDIALLCDEPYLDDGEAVIAMLDAMEREGHTCVLSSAVYFDGVHQQGYGCYVQKPYESYAMRPHQCHIGPTRAIAIARAFVAVFQKQESPQP